MKTRWSLLLVVFLISLVTLAGFMVQPRSAAQAQSVSDGNLATRVAKLEKANIDLEARVSELESLVDELTAGEVNAQTPVARSEADQDNAALAPTVEPENSSLNSDTLMAQIEEIEATEPTFSDTFPRDNGTWGTVENEYGSVRYADGALHLRVNTTSQELASFTSSPTVDQLNLDDFMVRVDVKKVAASTEARYGLFFRVSDAQNYYLFVIDNAGQYRVGKIVANSVEILKDWTAANAIKSGKNAVNELGVLAQGQTFVLLINNEIVAQVQDESISQGSVALVASASPNGDVDIAFDNLRIWRLGLGTSATHSGEAAAEPTPDANADISQLSCSELEFLAKKYESIADSSAGLCSSGDSPAATAACYTAEQAYSWSSKYHFEMAKRCGG